MYQTTTNDSDTVGKEKTAIKITLGCPSQQMLLLSAVMTWPELRRTLGIFNLKAIKDYCQLC